MIGFRGFLTGLFSLLLFGIAAGVAWWLFWFRPAGAAKPAAPPPPASVTKLLREDQVNTITLSPEAVQRLALQTGVVAKKTLARTRVYGGEVMIPPGQVVVVSAPLSGTLQAPPKGVPQPGQTVDKGQILFQLLPLVSPEGRVNLATTKIEAEGQVKSAETQREAARIALERAQRVFKSEAGSRRAVDEAQEKFEIASKAVETATARQKLLEEMIKTGTAAALPISSPESGLLRNVSALPGQNVPSGAALFEVIDRKQVWIRVPVYVGDLSEVDSSAPVQVGDLAARPGAPGQTAVPVMAPPSANPAAGTVDLFYSLNNRETQYSPGQRVGVALKLKTPVEGLAVPWSAVIHDIYGGTWIYEQTGPQTFVRRRVVIRYVVDDLAALAIGPALSTPIVVAGAAELFGTETGFTK